MRWTTRVLTWGLLLTLTFSPAVVAAETTSTPWVVRAADHVGFWEDEHVRWRSKFELRPEIKEAFGTIRLARAIPADHRVVEVSPASVELVRDAEGRVTGLRLPETRSAPWTVTLVVRQPLGGSGRLQPPMVGPRAPHRVTLQGAKFTPSDGSGLREHPGFVATDAIGRDRRRRIASSFGEPPDKADRPVFYRPTDLEGAALPGEAVAETVHKRRAVWVLGVALVLLMGVGAVAYRWLAGRAKEEEAERILEEHGVELDV